MPGSLDQERTQRFLQPPKDSTDLIAVIRGVIHAEDEAIDQYKKIIKMCDAIVVARLVGDVCGKGLISYRGCSVGVLGFAGQQMQGRVVSKSVRRRWGAVRGTHESHVKSQIPKLSCGQSSNCAP